MTTEQPPTTTKKTSFFGGIRNYFSKKSTEAPVETSTVPNSVRAISPSIASTTTTTVTPRTTPPNIVTSSTAGNLPVMSQTKNVVPISHTTTSATSTTTTTTSKPKLQEDFPPLGPPRRQNSVTSTTPSTSTLHSVWSTTPSNGQPVNFVPKQPSPPNVSPMLPTGIPHIEIASNSELEILTEELFNKETSSLFEKLTINYQGRTQSSSLTDEAPVP